MEDDSERSTMKASVDPFAAVEIDCEKQTGADWYRLALAAAYGGKAIHGLNATPTCEIITRQTEEYALKHATGRIHFNPAERNTPAMGADVTERPYTYRDFKAIRSSTGAFFASDQGLWEPSSRKRAREAALLAAIIASHTGDKEDACQLVSKITADKIDERAVDVANVLVSHLKRDMDAISKPFYRVFSCGTIQRSIRWDDSQLLAEKMPEDAAVDWGRITAVARFIAEANMQVDENFREYAQARGVPNALLRGCWANVAYGDFVLSASDFASVADIRATDFGVPSLAASYEFSADSILMQCF